MTLRNFVKVAERYAIDNSPTLMSAFAVTGTLATAWLTGKATFRAAEIIRGRQTIEDLKELGHEFTTKEKVGLVWKEYIPPAIAVVGTIGFIVTANSISSTRLAALAAAYKISEKQITEYKDKVQETFGKNKESEMRDQLAQDRVNNNPPHGQIMLPSQHVLCYDAYSSRYFRSDMQTLKKAQNELNRGMMMGSHQVATLSDWYDKIGMSNTKFSDDIGWNSENQVELDIRTTIADDDTPCLVVDFQTAPFPISSYYGQP